MPTCASCGQAIKAATLSAQQRAYWWAVIIPNIAEATGDDYESTHEDVKVQCWKRAGLPRAHRWKSKKTGKWRSRRLSIRDLSTKQMTSLINTARLWAAEFLGVEIPAPEAIPNRRSWRAA